MEEHKLYTRVPLKGIVHLYYGDLKWDSSLVEQVGKPRKPTRFNSPCNSLRNDKHFHSKNVGLIGWSTMSSNRSLVFLRILWSPILCHAYVKPGTGGLSATGHVEGRCIALSPPAGSEASLQGQPPDTRRFARRVFGHVSPLGGPTVAGHFVPLNPFSFIPWLCNGPTGRNSLIQTKPNKQKMSSKHRRMCCHVLSSLSCMHSSRI